MRFLAIATNEHFQNGRILGVHFKQMPSVGWHLYLEMTKKVCFSAFPKRKLLVQS
jgi:hypothetical protein